MKFQSSLPWEKQLNFIYKIRDSTGGAKSKAYCKPSQIFNGCHIPFISV